MATVPRLYESIKPSRYGLSLRPNLDTFTYEADEIIEFELVKPAKELVFHALDLKISDAMVDDAGVEVGYDRTAQTVTFIAKSELPAGKHRLEFELGGEIDDSLHGFYRSRYEIDGQEKWMATTQFEAVHAREAFVCIDEPAAKAVFDISLSIPEHLVAVSNTNVKTETVIDGIKHLVFNPSPKMSTYLVAFIIGDLAFKEAEVDGVKVRVYATPDKVEQTAYALEVGVKVLAYYNDYFAIAYPLPKLDMLAIPDFASGAMENWGAVTYRETALLFDEANSSIANRQRIATVIAHELAHQWFGNLVTMEWWNDLWLNEGFASWVEYLAVDHLYPEWEMWKQFVEDDYNYAMEKNGLANAPALQVDIEDPAELDTVFDAAVVYAKGATIIRMMHQYLGEAAFQKGLQQYLKQHQFGNTVTTDLWASLGAASGKSVADIMNQWTARPGYPVVQIDGQTLRQKRFYVSAREAKDDGATWPIPLAALLADGSTSDSVIMDGETLPLPKEWSSAAWFKLNPGQTGMYRATYTPETLRALFAPLADGTIPPIDRMGLLGDAQALTQAGLLPTELTLELIKQLRNDTDATVWSGILGIFGAVRNLLDGPERDHMAKFGLWLTEPIAKHLGNIPQTGESHLDQLLRPTILALRGRLGDTATIAYANELFCNVVEPDFRNFVYVVVGATGGRAAYDQLLALYRASDQGQERNRLLQAMAQAQQPDVIGDVEALILSKEVRDQDLIYGALGLSSNYEARAALWEFIESNWPEFLKRYGGGGHMLDHFPALLAVGSKTPAEAERLEKFFVANPHPAVTRPVKQATERILMKADWLARDHAAITKFLADYR